MRCDSGPPQIGVLVMGTRSSARLFIRSLARSLTRSLTHLLAPDPVLVGQTVLRPAVPR